MIKNKTQQFKAKYSNSLSTKNHLTSRVTSPQKTETQEKYTLTGFTHNTNNKSVQLINTKRLAKVESSSFIKNKQINSHQKTITFKPILYKKFQNDKSVCSFFNSKQNSQLFQSQALQQKTATEVTQKQQYLQKKLIQIKSNNSYEQFFKSLTPRTLFFCCKCLRYIFAIEKNMHYPKCQNQLNLSNLKSKQIHQIGWNRLNLILQLSQYTKIKSDYIKKMHNYIKDNEFQQFYVTKIYENVLFLRFQEIIQAFAYTYQKLLKGHSNQLPGMLSIAKIFSCIQIPKYQYDVQNKINKKTFF